MERDYHAQIPWLDDSAAAALSAVDALEDFYCHDRQLLRLKCPRPVLLARMAGWLNLALDARRLIDRFAVDAVRTGRVWNLAVRGRHQMRRLMLLELCGESAVHTRMEYLCGREKNQYKFGLKAILERNQYRIVRVIPDAMLEEALACELYCRMKKTEFQKGAEAARFFSPSRKIDWK